MMARGIQAIGHYTWPVATYLSAYTTVLLAVFLGLVTYYINAPVTATKLQFSGFFILLIVISIRYIYAGLCIISSLWNKRLGLYVKNGCLIFIGPRFSSIRLSEVCVIHDIPWRRGRRSGADIQLELGNGKRITVYTSMFAEESLAMRNIIEAAR